MAEANASAIDMLKVFLAYIEQKRELRIVTEGLCTRYGIPYSHGEAAEYRRNADQQSTVGPHAVPIIIYPSDITDCV